MMPTTVSSQGQIFLPYSLRKQFQIEKGDKVVFLPVDDAIVLKRIPKKLAKATLGILKEEIDTSGGVVKMHAKWKNEWEKTI